MKGIVIGLGLLASIAAAQPNVQPTISKRIAQIMSRADGTSKATAYKVKSIRDEYEIMQALGLTIKMQDLILAEKPYDLLTAVDPAGTEHQLWFDISSFYGKF